MSDNGGAEIPENAPPEPRYIRTLAMFAAAMMFAMMALTFTDVVGRYGFNSPIGATFEVIELIMGLLIFAALPAIARNRGHINVSLLDRFFKGRVRWFQQLFILLFSTGAAGFITYRMWAEMATMRRDQDVGEYLDLELWPFIAVICALSIITFLVLIGLVIDFVKTDPDAMATEEADSKRSAQDPL